MTQLVSARIKDEKRRRLAQGISDAAALIEARGWCVGGMEDRTGRVCLMGAVREVFLHDTHQLRFMAYDAVNKALGRDMTVWNDEQEHRDAVTQVLRVVAGKIGEHEQRKVCRHLVPLCSDCGLPAGCWNDECAGGSGERRHAFECPRRSA